MTFGVNQPVIDDTSDDLWSGATYWCDSDKGGLFIYLFIFWFSGYNSGCSSGQDSDAGRD